MREALNEAGMVRRHAYSKYRYITTYMLYTTTIAIKPRVIMLLHTTTYYVCTYIYATITIWTN